MILESSKLKEFADDNFKYNENGKKFSKTGRKLNTVGKEEIACYGQLSLFPQCFQRLVQQTCLTHYHTMPHFDALKV